MKKAGFTLIELLAVVLIVGILSAVALPQYQRAADKARLTEAFVFSKHVRDAQNMYLLANGQYAATFEELGLEFPPGSRMESPSKIKTKEAWYSIGRTHLTITALSKISLLVWYNGASECCAYADSDWKGTGLCKSLGAVGEGRSACGEGGGGCLCWRLQS